MVTIRKYTGQQICAVVGCWVHRDPPFGHLNHRPWETTWGHLYLLFNEASPFYIIAYLRAPYCSTRHPPFILLPTSVTIPYCSMRHPPFILLLTSQHLIVQRGIPLLYYCLPHSTLLFNEASPFKLLLTSQYLIVQRGVPFFILTIANKLSLSDTLSWLSKYH